MPLERRQRKWLNGVISGLSCLSDNKLMMPSSHLRVILKELALVIERKVSGAVVEMGCAGGSTSLRIAALLQLLKEGEGRPLHLYDSFNGFPPLTKEDDPGYKCEEGLHITHYSKDGPEGIIKLFKEYGNSLSLPYIHKGFFDELDSNSYPSLISFALLDSDIHDSIKGSLNIVWHRLSPLGSLVIHDYGNPSWPGVKLATDNFFFRSGLSANLNPCSYIERWIVRHNNLLVVTKKGM